jgi:tripartite-type tricarboxylate transporter receptor subunit TctC
MGRPTSGSSTPARPAVQDPEMKKQIDSQGMVGTGGTATAFGDYIKKDYARWVKVVKDAGIKIE